jgi:hypothetical protein
VGRDSDCLRTGLSGDRIPKRGGGENFSTRPDRSWGPPSLLYNGYWVILGRKAAGVWRRPPTYPHLPLGLKNPQSYNLYSPSGPSWLVLEWTSLDSRLLVTWCTSKFNIQQLYALPTLYLRDLYLSENKQRFVPFTTQTIDFYNRAEECLLRRKNWGFK